MFTRFLRKLFRKRMNPVPVYKAVSTKEKLSLLYMFATWNIMMIAFYNYYNRDKSIVKDSSGRAWAEYLGLNNVTIKTYDGFKKISTETYSSDEES